MKPINSLRFLILSVLLLPAVAAADSHDTFRQELDVPDALHLEVTTGSGSIDIDTGPGGSASIVGKVNVNRGGLFRRGGDADEIIQHVIDNPPVELSGDTLEVGHIEDSSIRRRVSISYTIVVPADTAIKAKTGAGSIDVDDVAADVEVRSGAGQVRQRLHPGRRCRGRH